MKPRFELPTGLCFACTQCGDCCRSWNVMLGPGERERITALDCRGRDEDLVEAPGVVGCTLPGSGQRVHRLARRDDGACVFLAPDNQCRIHQQLGARAKPLACRLYPFGFYPVEDRIAVDCSFACRSVSRGMGAPVAEAISQWADLLAEGKARTPRSRHALTLKRAMGGALLWELEHHLLELLSNSSLSMFDRIRCCLQFMRLATGGDPASESAARMRRAIARGLPRQVAKIPGHGGMDATQRTVFYQWLFLALNPIPVNFDLLSGRALESAKRQRLRAAKRFQRHLGPACIDNREIGCSFEEIASVDASLLEADRCEHLEAFLRAKIVGQRFLLAGDGELPLVEAVPAFFLTYPMAIWTSRALAAQRGARTVAEGDVRSALRLLDRTLGHLPVGALPRKLARAWTFLMTETDLVPAATDELLGRADEAVSLEQAAADLEELL